MKLFNRANRSSTRQSGSERTERTAYLRASLDPSLMRVDTLGGSNRLIVPVVMLVEGVIRASNAPAPELALASEFGKYPASWDGRPVVLGHPLNAEGLPTSANSPELYSSQLGILYNTRLEETKLISEIWFDVNSSNVGDTINRINSGDVVEVSTGLFMSLDPSSGFYNGEKYNGVWTNIAPDHLAVLSEGTIGACSIVDGCGAPRLNSTLTENMRMPASKDRVDKLVANCGGQFTEADRPWLSALTDEQVDRIAKLKEPAVAATTTTTSAVTTGGQSLADFLKGAPPEVAQILNESIRTHSARKTALVAQIRTNKSNVFSEEHLKAMSLEQLEGIAALAFGPDYSGAGGTFVAASSARSEETSIPVMEAFPRKVVKPGGDNQKGGQP